MVIRKAGSSVLGAYITDQAGGLGYTGQPNGGWHARAGDRHDRRDAAERRGHGARHRGRHVAGVSASPMPRRTTTAGFDLALVGYTASSAEGFLVAQYAAAHTKRLGYLVAHRPGFVAPTLTARKIATFDHLTDGRLAAAHHHRQERRRAGGRRRLRAQGRALPPRRGIPRSDEARLDERAALRFRGRVLPGARRASPTCSPLQQPHPLLFFGGSSEGALAMGAQALRRLRHLRRAAGVDARAHRRVPRAGRGLRPHAGLQHVVPADHRRHRRRGVGQARDRILGVDDGKKPGVRQASATPRSRSTSRRGG